MFARLTSTCPCAAKESAAALEELVPGARDGALGDDLLRQALAASRGNRSVQPTMMREGRLRRLAQCRRKLMCFLKNVLPDRQMYIRLRPVIAELRLHIPAASLHLIDYVKKFTQPFMSTFAGDRQG